MKFHPLPYQSYAITKMVANSLRGHKGMGLLFDPGLGKTVTTLSWYKAMRLRKMLVVAPLRVCYSVWRQEAERWDHLKGLRGQVVHGTHKQRENALATKSDFHLINPEGLQWLERSSPGYLEGFDAICVDESTCFKNWTAKRTKAIRRALATYAGFRVILTGTPTPNSLQDIFAQIWILDGGEALGKNITQFRERYFYRGGFGGYSWLPKPGAMETIEEKISHLVIRLSEEDHLSLPDLIVNDVAVDMPNAAMKRYRQLENEMFVELDGGVMTPKNAGGKYLLCRQIANGGCYAEDKSVEEFHTAKVEAVESIINELQGKPAMIAFQFKHDLPRLRKVFKRLPSIDGDTKGAEAEKLVEQWNDGKLPLLAVQPASLSHGVNMQAGPGRDVIWYGLTDSPEHYYQLNKRLHRQGVGSSVRIHRILARGTVDKAIARRLEDKASGQAALLKALAEYKSEKV